MKSSSMTGSRTLDDRVEALWDRWTEEAAAEGGASFYALLWEAVRGWFAGGGSLIVRRTRPAAWDMEVPLQLQLLEDDYLDEGRTETLEGGRRVGATGRCGD